MPNTLIPPDQVAREIIDMAAKEGFKFVWATKFNENGEEIPIVTLAKIEADGD
jgi:hypothetical protein